MNPVIHFEMPAKDTKRMADFYSKSFGWKANFLGAEMGNYVTVWTSETDENGMVKTPGTINGGFYPLEQNSPTVPSVVIGVDDIRAATQKVRDNGGEVLGEPVEIPGVGWYVSFHDTEGNRVSLIQPHMRQQ